MNLNNDVVYRRLRFGPLHQLHPGSTRRLVRYHDCLHGNFSSVINSLLGMLQRWKMCSTSHTQGPWAASERNSAFLLMTLLTQLHPALLTSVIVAPARGMVRVRPLRDAGDLPRSLAPARAAFAVAVAENPASRFMIRSRTRVVKRHLEGDW
jgi:hypothetical protein